jgi:hypothetical protein
MGATSVTGTGPGDSHGLYKPELQCGGCGCGFTEEEEESIIVKRGCVTTAIANGNATYVGSGSVSSIQVC